MYYDYVAMWLCAMCLSLTALLMITETSLKKWMGGFRNMMDSEVNPTNSKSTQVHRFCFCSHPCVCVCVYVYYLLWSLDFCNGERGEGFIYGEKFDSRQSIETTFQFIASMSANQDSESYDHIHIIHEEHEDT
ncbi:hypothetical protein DFH05DRAFT_1463591 [Lentinula detonsa]|uniref:Uncharacterized protein n=1 Tax=Lentinula detonsa TaxID=2804962 RepID=A0A9W8NS56_9AGAR|nr:hypothetical protein DFH05DRAFT_1463591 [Lentinula detonsa]